MISDGEPTDIDYIAARFFQIKTFRENQREAVASLINKQDVLAVFPTGSGKSLLYQIPALTSSGLTLVISPLISLMKDQVHILQNIRGIKDCDYICSLKSHDEIKSILSNLIRYKILYVTPERLKHPHFLKALREQNISISYIAVDEAHTVSLWGKTFRPACREIRKFMDLYPETPRIALTATATKEISSDLKEMLGLRNPAVYQRSAKRNNVALNILHTLSKDRDLLDLVKSENPAVVYTASVYTAERLAYFLTHCGIPSACYHGQMDISEKNRNQDDFISGRKNVITATSAFGMGIDKPDIRLVIHYHLPYDPEEYLQESGRAGRDGKQSKSVILLGPDDLKRQEKLFLTHFPETPIDLIENQTHSEYLAVRKEILQKFKRMTRIVSSSGCLQKKVLEYFGEAAQECGICGDCTSRKNGFHIRKLSSQDKKLLALLPSGFESAETVRRASAGLDVAQAYRPGYGAMRGIPEAEFNLSLTTLKNNHLAELTPDGCKIRIRPGIYQSLRSAL